MDEPIVEKVDENTVKVTKTPPPEETLYDIPTLKMNRENLFLQREEAIKRAHEHADDFAEQIEEIDALLEKAAKL